MQLKPLARKVLLIGWDAADWRVIDPLLAEEKMPHLARFLTQGVRGNIATLYPAFSPMLWTSIATGKRPYKHGIHGFTEPTPDGRGVRAITNLGRTTKAVWNILHQAGKTSNVIGWWPSHPAEPIRGVMISNHYQRAVAKIDKPWPLLPGTVHPERLTEPLSEFRLHPEELDHTHIGPFVPRFGEINQDKDKRLEPLARTISEAASIHGAATALMQLEPWDFMAVYYDSIDHFGHGFMRYHPPRQPGISEEDFELYSGVIEGAYRFHDMMLGALLALAGEETTVILMSDHGFHPDQNRTLNIPVEPAGPAVEHRHYGILAMKGPNIRRNERIYGASVLDVCPTILRLFGLPSGADMDGKVLATAFEQAPETPTIPSWDEVPGEAGRHAAGMELDSVAAAETMRQMIDLGYIEPLPEDKDKAVRQTTRELRFNLAQSYMGGMHFAEAVPILEELWDAWPEEHRFGISLATCLAALRKRFRRGQTLDRLEANMKTTARDAATALEKYRDAEGNYPLDDLTDVQRYELRRLAALASPNLRHLDYLRATQLFLEGRTREAVEALERIATGDRLSPELQMRLGYGLLRMGNPERAEACFRAALEQETEEMGAYLGLAEAREAQGDYAGMLEHALAATELVFYNPRAHALVGRALLHSKQYDEAEQAFKLALHQNPTERIARKGLTSLYNDLRPDPHKLIMHKRQMDRLVVQIRARPKKQAAPEVTAERTAPLRQSAADSPADAPAEQIITVVSGLPRSGTSMMMQMLVAGGITPYTDDNRAPDSDNPRGYFEHDQATRLASNAAWLPEARGKVVKIVAPLLPSLPDTEYYSIVLMHRDLSEVVASQGAMLKRLGRSGAALEGSQLRAALAQQMERVERWCGEHPRVRVLHLDYSEVIANPEQACRRLAIFLNRTLDLSAMQGAVDPSLQRQRRPSPSVSSTLA